MKKKDFVTQADVSNAAESLLKLGSNPTILNIRALLGKGSNSTIARYINEWRNPTVAIVEPDWQKDKFMVHWLRLAVHD